MINHTFTGVFIPAKIWVAQDLIPQEKMMLAEIKALSEDKGWCFANNSHFAKWLGCGTQNISNYIKRFEREGMIEVTYTDKKTFAGRKMRVNIEWFHGLATPYTGNVTPYTGNVTPYTGNVTPYTGNVTEIHFKDTSKLNESETPPPAENFNDLKAEIPPPPKVAPKGSAPSEAAAPLEEKDAFSEWLPSLQKAWENNAPGAMPKPTHIVKTTGPENPGVTEVEGITLPAATKQDVVLDPYSYPNAKTAMELQERMRAYFMMYPDEWLVNVLHNAKVSDWPEEKTEGCVLKFCLYKEKVNDLRRTFNQFRADLTLWFIEERTRFARSSPSNTTYAPTNQKANLNRLGSDAAAYREKPLF